MLSLTGQFREVINYANTKKEEVQPLGTITLFPHLTFYKIYHEVYTIILTLTPLSRSQLNRGYEERKWKRSEL